MSLEEVVIIGLGNPGKKYELTRHNMGFLAVKALATDQGWDFKEEKRFQAQIAQGQMEGRHVTLIMPMTYMNESGTALRRYLDYYKLGPESVIVVVDDTAIPFNTMRLRKKGSPGGHNGLKSIEVHLGTDHYTRLRLGISNDHKKGELVDYVLGIFSEEEVKKLPDFVKSAAEVLKSLIRESFTVVMNRINTKCRPPKEGQENKI